MDLDIDNVESIEITMLNIVVSLDKSFQLPLSKVLHAIATGLVATRNFFVLIQPPRSI